MQEERARYFVKDLNMFLYKCDVERSWRINPADVPKNPIIFITGKFTVEEVKKWVEVYSAGQPCLVCCVGGNNLLSKPLHVLAFMYWDCQRLGFSSPARAKSGSWTRSRRL